MSPIALYRLFSMVLIARQRSDVNPSYLDANLAWHRFMGLEQLQFVVDPKDSTNHDFTPEVLVRYAEVMEQYVRRAHSLEHSSVSNVKIPVISFPGLVDVKIRGEGSDDQETDDATENNSGASKIGDSFISNSSSEDNV